MKHKWIINAVTSSPRYETLGEKVSITVESDSDLRLKQVDAEELVRIALMNGDAWSIETTIDEEEL